MPRPPRVRPPHAARETAHCYPSRTWKGFGGLFTLSVIVAPMLAFQAPQLGGRTILDDGSLVPLGVVVALIIAVFRAGQQMQKLTDKLKVLDKLVADVAVLKQHAGIVDELVE